MFIDTICDAPRLGQGRRIKLLWAVGVGVWSVIFRGSIQTCIGLLNMYRPTKHAGVRGNEIADRLARDGSAQRFVGPEPFLGVSRQNIRLKMKRWMDKQHLALWRGPCSTQRQARELIWGPDPATGA